MEAADGSEEEAAAGAADGVEEEAVVAEEESELDDPLNAGCGTCGHGKCAGGWPLWSLPFAYAKNKQRVSLAKAK